MANNFNTQIYGQSSLPLTSPDKLVVCPWEGCGRYFHAQFSLNRHMIVHTQPKNLCCMYCERRFTLAQYLREHQYTHTKELPYICGISGCCMRFRQAGKLSLHRKTHPEYRARRYDYSLNKEKRTKKQDDKKSLIKITDQNHESDRKEEKVISTTENNEILKEDEKAKMININLKMDPLPIIPCLHNVLDHTIITASNGSIKPENSTKFVPIINNMEISFFIKIIDKIINETKNQGENLCGSILPHIKDLATTSFSTLDLLNLIKNKK